MKVLGNRLEQVSTMLPSGGIFGTLLPVLGHIGIAAAAFDFGMPELEKFVAGCGMFAAGVLMSRSLPVWREAKPGEIERIQRARESGLLAPWVRLGRRLGMWRAILVFFAVCAVLATIATVLGPAR